MTIHVNIGEAKTQLSKLVAAVLRGERVILDRAGEPQVELVPIDRERASAAVYEQRMAWMGSFRGKMPENAGDLFLEPTYTDEELEEIENNPLIPEKHVK